MTDVTRVGLRGHSLALIWSNNARSSPMRFFIINLFILCAIFFTSCRSTPQKGEDRHAETLLQEARYFQCLGYKELAQEKARYALRSAKNPHLVAELEVFLRGDSAYLETLPPGEKRDLLLGERCYRQEKYLEALGNYEKALHHMEGVLSDIYERRSSLNPYSLGVYKQRLCIRHMQLKIAKCLIYLKRDQEALAMLNKVILHKSWEEVAIKVKKLEGKPLNPTLYTHDHIGHTAAQFASITESEELYLLKRSLALASKKGFFQ